MQTEKEIKTNFKKLHDDLSDIYYDGTMGMSKEEFDNQHGMIWDTMRDELIAGGFITVPPPPRDLKAEIDELKIKVDALEKL